MFWFQPRPPFSDERERLGDLRGLLTCLHVCPEFPYQPALCDSLAVLVRSMIWSPLFFCPKSGFLNEWLIGEEACRFAHVSLSNSDTSTVCHCKHGSGDVSALHWKELWWWWEHLNYEDASMLIADLAEPPSQCFRAAQLLWKKRLYGTTICKICNKKVIHNDVMLITRMLGWLRIKQSSALEPPAQCFRAAQLL